MMPTPEQKQQRRGWSAGSFRCKFTEKRYSPNNLQMGIISLSVLSRSPAVSLALRPDFSRQWRRTLFPIRGTVIVLHPAGQVERSARIHAL